MKKTIVTLVMTLALVGFVRLTASMAATPKTKKASWCTSAYTNFIGAPGSCPAIDPGGSTAPKFMGGVGY